MNDDAVCLENRGDRFAGKHRSHRYRDRLLEPGLPAMNDDAVCLENRGDWFAGKPRSNGIGDLLWERPGWGSTLPAINDDAVCLPGRDDWIAGKRKAAPRPVRHAYTQVAQ